jgi:hypothetical protein
VLVVLLVVGDDGLVVLLAVGDDAFVLYATGRVTGYPVSEHFDF